MTRFGVRGRHRLTPSRGRRLLAVGAVSLGTLAGVTLSAGGAGAAGTLGTYSVTVSPTSAAATTSTTFAVTFTTQNVPSNADLLHSVSVSFPAGFSGISAPSTAQGSDGTWNVTTSGSTVSLTSTSALGLLPGQSVSVPITAIAPSAQGSYTLATTGTGTLGDAFSTTSSPTVTVGPAPTGSYTASVSPTSAPATTSSTFTVAFSVVSAPSSTNGLHAASVSFPSGFSGVSAPATVTSSGGTWDVTASGSTVSLKSESAAGLPTGGTVSVPVTATLPSSTGSYPLTTTGTSSIGDAFTTTSAPSITATTAPTAVATCSSTQTCDTKTVGSASNTQAEVVSTPNASSTADAVDVWVGTLPAPACASSNPVYGQPVTYTTQDLSRIVTVTLRLDKSLVQANPNNGVSQYSVCYEGKHSFPTKQGGTATQAGPNDFYGDLAACGSPAVAPCLASINKNKAGDLVATIDADPGEPSTSFH